MASLLTVLWHNVGVRWLARISARCHEFLPVVHALAPLPFLPLALCHPCRSHSRHHYDAMERPPVAVASLQCAQVWLQALITLAIDNDDSARNILDAKGQRVAVVEGVEWAGNGA